MNANELADLLADSNDPDIRRAVAMLRQQEAEIKTLTKFLDETCQTGKFIVWNSTDKAQE